MIAAKVRLLNRQSTRETANVIGISSQYIGFASIIIAHAPELADLVINGSRALFSMAKIRSRSFCRPMLTGGHLNKGQKAMAVAKA